MKAIMALPLLLAALALPASAQGSFPVDKPYGAISISGFDVQKMGLSLTVSRDARADGMRGSGNAGCNRWTANVMLRDDQIDFTNNITTKMACAKPKMTAEDAFLTSLRSAKRWRVDGDRLIIEGDAARLLMKAGAAETRRPAQR